MIFRPSSSNKELSCVLFFAERKEETRLRHRVRQRIILVSYLIESRCPDPVMCKRSGSAASPDMKDSVTKFKIPQTGANYGRASPWPPPPRVSCDSESRETSGTDGERAVFILICTSPILATMAAQRSDSDNMQKRGKTFHLIYFRMNIRQKIAV